MFNHALEPTPCRSASVRCGAVLAIHCASSAHIASGISQSFNIRSASARLVADPGSNSVSAACRSSCGGLPSLVGGDSHQYSQRLSDRRAKAHSGRHYILSLEKEPSLNLGGLTLRRLSISGSLAKLVTMRSLVLGECCPNSRPVML